MSGGTGTPLLLVSDFGVANLGALLASRGTDLGVSCRVAPFGDVGGALLGHAEVASGAEGQKKGEGEEAPGLLVWTRPQGVLPAVRDLVEGETTAYDRNELLAEVDRFADLVEEAATRHPFVLLASWTLPPGARGLGMLDLAPGQGAGAALLEANGHLARRVASMRGVYLLDASRWVAASDPEEAARLWYLAKIPYSRDTFERAADDILGALGGLRGRARKLLVVDLDDTLWGGILGDAGWEGLRLGGHDPVGEAYLDFQRALKALTRRGVILAVVSKNDEDRALDAMRKHPEMVIRPEDLAGWRINWEDKARNVAELVEELNLGLDATVFLDDNPSERGRVREALPGVLVPEWPEDPLRYAPRLRAMPCFDLPSLSEEDRARAGMYAAERQRKEVRARVGSMEDWIRSLEVRVVFEPLSEANLPRATQLLNKTNQMNLRTRRMTEPEFLAWSREEGHGVWTVRVADRFGDYGLTGLLGIRVAPDARGDGGTAYLEDFVLSCRVFGRRVEEAMVHVAAREAGAAGARRIVAELLPTEKNKPCREFWSERSAFDAEGEGGDSTRYIRSLEAPYPPPPALTVEG